MKGIDETLGEIREGVLISSTTQEFESLRDQTGSHMDLGERTTGFSYDIGVVQVPKRPS